MTVIVTHIKQIVNFTLFKQLCKIAHKYSFFLLQTANCKKKIHFIFLTMTTLNYLLNTRRDNRFDNFYTTYLNKRNFPWTYSRKNIISKRVVMILRNFNIFTVLRHNIIQVLILTNFVNNKKRSKVILSKIKVMTPF